MRSYPISRLGVISADRSGVKSAADPDFDPYYGDPPQGQVVDGQSFADLRDQMNDRKYQTARRMQLRRV